MNIHANKTEENKSQSVSAASSKIKNGSEFISQFVDNRTMSITQRKLQEQFIQKKENNTGLPDNLKSGMENLSGMSLDHVKVHRNSSKPASVQAHAYAQGSDIHLASGQEKHLPHELSHVVQQAEGRVQPTTSVNGVAVNDNEGLENEADVMGAKALQVQLKQKESNHSFSANRSLNNSKNAIQRKKLQVKIDGEDGRVFVKAQGRPKGWSSQVTKKLVPEEGQSRGHIIEWNIRLRAFENETQGMKLDDYKQYINSNAYNKIGLEKDTVVYLKNLYNDLGNLILNDTSQDNDAGGIANDLTQGIEAGKFKGEEEKKEALKKIFKNSFNPGNNIKGHIAKYIKEFSLAWNIDQKELGKWALEIFGFPKERDDDEMKEEEVIEQEEGNYIYGNGLQNYSEKWIEETYQVYKTSPNGLKKLLTMLETDYEDVDKRMQGVYEKYYKKIGQRL